MHAGQHAMHLDTVVKAQVAPNVDLELHQAVIQAALAKLHRSADW